MKNDKDYDDITIENNDILKKISDISEEIEVPETLLAENMMKRLQRVKQEKINENSNLGNSGNGENNSMEGGIKRRGFKWWHKAVMTGVSFAVLVLGVFVFRNIQNDNLKSRSNHYRLDAIHYSGEALSAGEGTDVVKGASNREEIEAIIKNISMKRYTEMKNNRTKSASNTKEDMLITGYDEEALTYNWSFDATNSGVTTFDGSTSEGDNDKEDDYYKNNDQVEGVQEADYVITDGKYIYTICDTDAIRITEVKGSDINHLSQIDLKNDVIDYFKSSSGMDGEEFYDFRPSISICEPKLYINGSHMIVALEYRYYFSSFDDDNFEDQTNYYTDGTQYYTMIMNYDLSDINHPIMSDAHKIEGAMVSSRMVMDYLYVVTDRQIDTWVSDLEAMSKILDRISNSCIPKIDDNEISYENIYISDVDEMDYCYQVIAAFEIKESGLELTDSVAVLSSEYSDVYVSNDNIYTFSETEAVKETKTLSDERKSETITDQTRIYKFCYKEGVLTPYAVGLVKGNILDQFSMDEYNGYLRLVSNINEYSYARPADDNEVVMWYDFYDYEFLGDKTENALYILDDKLNTCGSIEGIAQNEDIYSARFSQDRAYFVTYRQMDPLFVADLSDVNNPVIIDELEMTGYSDYLQKWNDDELLGIGIESTEEGLRTGVKIALYNIKEDTSLEEITKTVYKNWYSYAAYNYKNMMISPDKSLLGMEIYDEKHHSHYMLFSIDNGEITNILDYMVEDYEEEREYKENFITEYIEDRIYFSDNEYNHTYRALYIGNYIYIITLDRGISAVDMSDYSVVNFEEFGW